MRGATLHLLTLALAVAAGAGFASPAAAQYPSIPVWSFPGAFQAGPDSIREQPRTITLRWLRDPAVERRPEFGGYRIYRVFNAPDTTRMVLIRRFSVNANDSLFMWHFPNIDSLTPLPQRVATFVDPDSNGVFVKRCREVDHLGRCISRGDSIIVLMAPPGPHDGFRTWYAITYEQRNFSGNSSSDYQDLFIPDTINCATPASRDSCPNLNHKARNLTSTAVEPTSGPKSNVETVAVVPNPFRASEAWDRPGGNEIHFINLPSQAKITIYSSAGDLVRELDHNDNVRDFAVWDLKNGAGQDVSSGIYMFRVVSGIFTAQSRFVVIR